jgi:16S rRNA (guanine1516-N2)-methyltransferase
MYPERRKSARVKKNMQLLQQLLGQDQDTEQLLQAALHCARQRVVVKRPKGAEPIPGFKPTTRVESKKTRYDVYVSKLFAEKNK